MLEVKGRETENDILKYKSAYKYCKNKGFEFIVTGKNCEPKYINEEVLTL